MDFFLKRNGAQEGPFTSNQLEAMLREGRVSRTDLAFHEGLSNWMPLAAVLAPRTKPPPFQTTPTPESSAAPNAGPEVKLPRALPLEPVSLASLWRWVLADRPWTLPWALWLVSFAVLPALAVSFCGPWDDTPPRAVAFLAIYVALAAALAMRVLVKSSASHSQSAMTLAPVPSLALIVLLLLGLRFGWSRQIISATADGSPLGKALALFGIWAVGQGALVGLICWERTRSSEAPRLLRLGTLAGMLLAATPAFAQYVERSWLDGYRGTALGAFRSPSIPSVLSGMAVGLCLGGVMATVLTHWLRRDQDRRVVLGGAVVGGAVWMTLYSLTPANWLHAFFAGASALGLVTCIRTLDPVNQRQGAFTPQP